MIAAVRYFLQCTRCLNRDAGVVQGHVGIRRLRKGLLSDLSSFVKSTKRLQEIVETQPSTEELQNQLDELVLKAFKVVTRAVRFLDVWLQDVAAQDVGAAAAGEQGRARPLQPPTESAVEENANHEAAQSRPQEIDFAAGQNSSILLPERAHSVSSGGTGVAQSAPNPHPAHELGQATVQDPSQPSDAVPAIQLVPPRSASVSHRLSYSMRSGIPAQKNSLASEKLSAAQDAFLGYIGSFIGLHLQSRSSSELLVITQQSVAACRQLLVVVDEVWERDARRSETLEQARNNMQDRLGDLVQATQDLFTPSEAEGSDHVLMPDQGKHLVAAATSCVRSAGDCVGKTRQVIEKIGDFEFEAVGLGLSESIFNRLPSLAASYYTEQPNTQTNTEDTASEISQSSSSRPAPPPLYQSVSKPLPKTPLASPPIEKSLPPITQTTASVPDSLENGPPLRPPLTIDPPTYSSDTRSQSPESATKPVFDKEGRAESIGVSVSSSSNDTDPYSYRDSETSGLSTISTRATTPDQSPSSHKDSEKQLLSSFGSLSDIQSSILEEPYDAESQVLEKTYAHELIYNKEGQVAGGSLPALIEKLTTHDSTPDAMFVTTFYLTFRLFTTPVEFSQLLINRFEYVSESRHMARPVQLRVYNVFKGWLESHWQGDTDSEALPMILPFATGRLRAALPAAGRRLAELTAKVSEVHAGALVPRLISSVGKTNTSIGLYTDKDTQLPNPIITKSQLNALRNAKNGGNPCSILDFDPLELARQFTIIESRIFCAIQSEELLGLEWTNKNHSKAVNVRAMSKLSTDLANLVADTILSVDDAKKRAIVIKQWVKIGMKCLELNNYDSLMAIICSLNSSMVLRLKRTWELVSVKTRNRLEELRAVVDCSKNYAVLRQRLENEIAPCLPFVGIYLTDLTFVDVGNQTTRQLPGSRNGEGAAVINFDKHMKTAKIIGQLQRFQIPYKLVAVPEMQDWMESQIRRVRSSEETNVQQFYRRSLYLEPRETRPASKPSPSEHNEGTFPDNGRSNSKDHGREKFDFSRAFTFSSSQKEKLAS
ncbi:ras GEF [Viridothelium virens]|uniref:Ras GEF n=1 Tax=Viridothelium virens TaxID=1048519 RepID=A0A6A6HCA7_VIRVR|nr:ras GEF [Viridothelium virens]